MYNLQTSPWKFCFPCREVPGRTCRAEEGRAAGVLACLLAGGEGDVGEKKEGAKSYLGVCSARAGTAGGGLGAGAGGRRRFCAAAGVLR